MPYFAEGVIQVGCQLDGFVAATISLNVSTELPCDGIGTMAQQPNLELRPKDVNNGTAQAHIPDCSIIAVNMYSSLVVTYWVQDSSGATWSTTGTNKVNYMDRLNTTASIALVLRATAPSAQRRDLAMHDCEMAGQAIAERALKSRDNAIDTVQDTHDLQKRTVSVPDLHTATMSLEVCAAIKCNNNGGQPAVFNRFTMTCGCKDPVYVEVDHSS